MPEHAEYGRPEPYHRGWKVSPLERLLDSPRNPWAYVWRCAVHGHDNKDGKCRRCGLSSRGA